MKKKKNNNLKMSGGTFEKFSGVTFWISGFVPTCQTLNDNVGNLLKPLVNTSDSITNFFNLFTNKK